MSKVAKPSDNSPDPGSAGAAAASDAPPHLTLDLRVAVGQHLRLLQKSGLSFLPARAGQEFEFAEPEASTLAPPNTTSSGDDGSVNLNRMAAVAEATPGKPRHLDPGRKSAVGNPGQSSQPAASDRVQEAAESKTFGAVGGNPVSERRPSVDRPVIAISQAYGDKPAGGRVSSSLEVLNEEVASCVKCSQLAECRNQTVFGVGNPKARLVLLGEAPGAQEDRVGEPFVGAAGQLLDRMLAACGLNRHEHVYILNTIKCRPPQNRNPKQDEIENCWGYAQRQLEIIQPEFICCLGSVAARVLLQTSQSVGRLRKQFHQYRGSRVLVTYHPAYLLRTTSAKKHAWEDMQLLMREMGIKIPDK